jgi:hypothetical protein
MPSTKGYKMRDFRLSNYAIAKVRDGQSQHEKDKALINMPPDNELVVYRHDVYTYYFSVPCVLMNKVGFELLEFFYQDNYDYSDEKLNNFKEEYKKYFNEA